MYVQGIARGRYAAVGSLLTFISSSSVETRNLKPRKRMAAKSLHVWSDDHSVENDSALRVQETGVERQPVALRIEQLEVIGGQAL